MSKEDVQFDEPELKAAVARVKGGHVASPALRQQVMRRMAQARTEMTLRPQTSRPWYMSRTFLAMAAMIVIAVGAATTMYVAHLRHEAHEREEYVEDNRPLLLAMIDSFKNGTADDASAQVLDHQSDAAAISSTMSKQLGREIPSVRLAGWTVESAAITSVGPVQAGRWQLAKDGKRIIVLSLPATAFKYEEGYSEYDARLNDHAIAGYLRGNSINCVVGDAVISDREAINLRDEIRRS